ncbi:MAG: porphyrinogen peroxidase [Actinomycetota bacterium]|jgi:putative iron-dependent peroxidase|nr:porphyrinogen peroxidase [Actinomycetota bacterium]
MANTWDRVPIEPQTVNAPLSRSAIFLVVRIAESDEALAAVRGVISDIGGLVRAVGFRDLGGQLSCIVGIGRAAWDRLGRPTRPSQLHPFAAVRGAVHTAVSTPGDLLFHIRAEVPDMCFELERLVLEKLGAHVTVEDEVTGFRYFDARDLLGFVDGTENPMGAALEHDTLIGSEDEEFAGGSYVVVQKYLHDLTAWGKLSVAEQERIVGRTKLDNVELESAGDRLSHKDLNTIVDSAGLEHDILRDNMPFGRPGAGEFGTYFIGYAADLSTVEKMLERMFVGVPPGQHDRILDFSKAVTGSTYFVPSNDLLESLAD